MLKTTEFINATRNELPFNLYHYRHNRGSSSPVQVCVNKALHRVVWLNHVIHKKLQHFSYLQLRFIKSYFNEVAELRTYQPGAIAPLNGQIVRTSFVFFKEKDLYVAIRVYRLQQFLRYDEDKREFILVKEIKLPV